jgi:cation transport ATPase
MVLLGNEKLMAARGIEFSPAAAGGTLVYAAVEGRYAGFLRIEDELKPDAAATITALHRYGVKKTVMLTGDSTAAGEKAAAALGIDEVCICFFHHSDHLFKILCDEAVVGIQHFHVLSRGCSQSDVDA